MMISGLGCHVDIQWWSIFGGNWLALGLLAAIACQPAEVIVIRSDRG